MEVILLCPRLDVEREMLGNRNYELKMIILKCNFRLWLTLNHQKMMMWFAEVADIVRILQSKEHGTCTCHEVANLIGASIADVMLSSVFFSL